MTECADKLAESVEQYIRTQRKLYRSRLGRTVVELQRARNRDQPAQQEIEFLTTKKEELQDRLVRFNKVDIDEVVEKVQKEALYEEFRQKAGDDHD